MVNDLLRQREPAHRARMLEAGADAYLTNFVPKCLALVSSTDFAALFRVRRDPAACIGGHTLGLDETPVSE